MDNQHKKIKGYRDLSADEIALMNDIKDMAEQVRKLCARLDNIMLDEVSLIHEIQKDPEEQIEDYVNVSGHNQAVQWLDSGRLDLQVGFMKLVRSVARPTMF